MDEDVHLEEQEAEFHIVLSNVDWLIFGVEINQVVVENHNLSPIFRDKRVTEIDWNLWYMLYFPQYVLLFTSTVHDQSANIKTQNTKSLKIDWIHKCYVSCFKLEYFFKSCKT